MSLVLGKRRRSERRRGERRRGEQRRGTPEWQLRHGELYAGCVPLILRGYLPL